MATRYSQPQIGTLIDWSNPLCEGLSHVSVGDVAVDIVSKKLGTLVGTVSKVVSPEGTALQTATGGGNRVDFPHAKDTGSSEYSFGSIFTQVNPAAFQYLILRELAGALGGTYTILFGLQNVGGLSKLQISFGTAGFFQSATTIPNTGWHVASASTPPNGDVIAANAAIWLDGVKDTLANSANGGTVGASTQTNLYLNGRPSDNLRQLNGAQALRVEWRRKLTDEEHASFAENPWQIFLFLARSLWMFGAAAGGGGSVVDLAADAAAQASATAGLLKGVSLAGAALGVASATAGMAHTVPMAATATATASSTAGIALTVTFAADAVASALATAALAIAKTLGANAQATTTAGAGMAVDKPLAASAVAQDTATAALDVTAGGSTVNLAAAATSMDTATATLSLVVNLSAAAVAQATATATLGGSSALAAAAIANAQASAALAVGKPLAAAAAGVAAGGANLWLDVPLGAQALATAAAGGTLSLTINLAASALGQASAGAFLPSNISLAAGAVSLATGTATLMVTGPIVGNAAYVAREPRRSWAGEERSRGWTSAERRRPWTARSN